MAGACLGLLLWSCCSYLIVHKRSQEVGCPPRSPCDSLLILEGEAGGHCVSWGKHVWQAWSIPSERMHHEPHLAPAVCWGWDNGPLPAHPRLLPSLSSLHLPLKAAALASLSCKTSPLFLSPCLLFCNSFCSFLSARASLHLPPLCRCGVDWKCSHARPSGQPCSFTQSSCTTQIMSWFGNRYTHCKVLSCVLYAAVQRYKTTASPSLSCFPSQMVVEPLASALAFKLNIWIFSGGSNRWGMGGVQESRSLAGDVCKH